MVEIVNPKISSSAFYVYIIPLVVMVMGVFVGLRLGQNAGYEDLAEVISVVTGIVFLFFSYILLSIFDRKKRINQQEESLVRMKEIIEEEEVVDEKKVGSDSNRMH